MAKLDYGKPIRIFYENMLRIGLTLEVHDGKLAVGGNLDILSPVLKAEIIKRAPYLIELLTTGGL